MTKYEIENISSVINKDLKKILSKKTGFVLLTYESNDYKKIIYRTNNKKQKFIDKLLGKGV